MKFDIKEFFLLHTEKFVFGIAILLMCSFMFGGNSLEPLNWEPEVLSRLSDDASNHIDTNVVEPKDVDVVVKDYHEYAKGIKANVKLDRYRTENMWEPPLFPDPKPRRKPELFAVKNLKGESGVGAILATDRTATAPVRVGAVGAAGASSRQLEGKRWIVLVGEIPIKEQLDEYINAFSNASYTNPQNDVPYYAAYKVFRRELPNGEYTELDPIREFLTEVRTWNGTGLEQVDKVYLAPQVSNSPLPMAYPLPPLAKVIFGDSVAYPPAIPRLQDELIEQEAQSEELRQAFENVGVMDTDEFIKRPMEALPGRTGGNDGFSGFENRNNTGVGAGNRGGFMSSADLKLLAEKMQSKQEPVTVSSYLFRYFDFNVVPGKTYQYKVQLYLINPNYRLQDMFVEDPDLTLEPYIATDISHESKPVTVNNDTRILAKDISTLPYTEQRPWVEPMVSLTSIYFDMEKSSEWILEPSSKSARGLMANFSGNPRSSEQTSSTPDRAEEPVKPGQRNPKPVKPVVDPTKPTVFNSDICVIDVTGGYPIPGTGSNRSPGKMLVMYKNGEIEIHDTTKDAIEIEMYSEKSTNSGSSTAPSGGSSSPYGFE